MQGRAAAPAARGGGDRSSAAASRSESNKQYSTFSVRTRGEAAPSKAGHLSCLLAPTHWTSPDPPPRLKLASGAWEKHYTLIIIIVIVIPFFCFRVPLVAGFPPFPSLVFVLPRFLPSGASRVVLFAASRAPSLPPVSLFTPSESLIRSLTASARGAIPIHLRPPRTLHLLISRRAHTRHSA